jgi:hypothetical protein
MVCTISLYNEPKKSVYLSPGIRIDGGQELLHSRLCRTIRPATCRTRRYTASGRCYSQRFAQSLYFKVVQFYKYDHSQRPPTRQNDDNDDDDDVNHDFSALFLS